MSKDAASVHITSVRKPEEKFIPEDYEKRWYDENKNKLKNKKKRLYVSSPALLYLAHTTYSESLVTGTQKCC